MPDDQEGVLSLVANIFVSQVEKEIDKEDNYDDSCGGNVKSIL